MSLSLSNLGLKKGIKTWKIFEKKRDKGQYIYFSSFFKFPTDQNLSNSILSVLQQQQENSDNLLSFQDFVTFLINGTRSNQVDEVLSRKFHLNTHWMPYWRLCAPCHSQALPNTIVKMDHQGQFQQEVIQRRKKFTIFYLLFELVERGRRPSGAFDSSEWSKYGTEMGQNESKMGQNGPKRVQKWLKMV